MSAHIAAALVRDLKKRVTSTTEGLREGLRETTLPLAEAVLAHAQDADADRAALRIEVARLDSAMDAIARLAREADERLRDSLADALTELTNALRAVQEQHVDQYNTLRAERDEAVRHRVDLVAAVKLTSARLARVDGGDSMVIATALDALSEAGEEFDLEAFIEAEDKEAVAQHVAFLERER